nr:MAG TPA: Orn [Caudoviricetes sp.]
MSWPNSTGKEPQHETKTRSRNQTHRAAPRRLEMHHLRPRHRHELERVQHPPPAHAQPRTRLRQPARTRQPPHPVRQRHHRMPRMGTRPPRARLPARLPRPHARRSRKPTRLLLATRLAAAQPRRHTTPGHATPRPNQPHSQRQEHQGRKPKMNPFTSLPSDSQTIPLDPPRPSKKPHMLLWIDTETTGISRTDAKLLEIGMIVTSLDGAEEGDRFVCPVRPDHLSLYDLSPYVLRMHLDNGLLDTVLEAEPSEYGYANVARNLSEFLRDEAAQYELHPAGTNVDYDIALGHNPYKGHAGSHRVTDCIKRDRNDYAYYLDIIRAGQQQEGDDQ